MSSPIVEPLFTLIPTISPSPSEVSPVLNVAEPLLTSSLSMMFITPAIASDPYCADAPSRNISTRFIASVGIADISAPVSPRPGEVCVYKRALKFLRLPFTKINVLEGPIFRIS